MSDILLRKINEVYLQVICDKAILAEMAAYFTFDVPGARFMPAYKNKLWDGKKRLLNSVSQTIYVGLHHHIVEFAQKSGYSLESEDDVYPTTDTDMQQITEYIALLKLHSKGVPLQNRDYQLEAIKNIIDNRRATIVSPTSSGKSLIIYASLRYLFATKKIKRSLLVFPTTGLVSQMAGDFKDYSSVNGWDVDARSHSIYSGQDKNTNKPIVFSTYQSLAKMPMSYFSQFDCVYVDECFTPDTEILTNKGFVRFDELTEIENVAQYDNGDISFVKPTKYIKQHYTGKMVKLYGLSSIDLLMTPNHDVLLQRVQKHKTVDIKIKAADVKFYNSNMYVAGNATGIDNILSDKEKLMIALQADGCIVGKENEHKILQFQFSKERKITEFLDLMQSGSFSFSETKSVKQSGNTAKKRRFSIYDIDYATKNISSVIDISTISTEKAKAIIEYMILWDGWISPKGLYYYSNTDESSVDFYQTIAILAGYKARKTIQIDNRSEKYSDVYRLYIQKTNITGTQGIKKSEIEYCGNVHCVSVPSGNIIVRRNGKPVVIGNCHGAESKSITGIMEKCRDTVYRVGFTGTLNEGKVHKLVIEGLFGKASQMTTTKEMMDSGQSAQLKITCMLLKYNDKTRKILAHANSKPGAKSKTHATYAQEMDFICTYERRNNFIAKLAESLKGNTLILFQFVEKQGLPIYTKLKEHGNCHFIHGDVGVEDRNDVREIAETTTDCTIVASYGTFSTGISIKRIDNIIFASPYKSKIKVLQSVGRGLRVGNGKMVCNLYDIADDISYKSYKNHTLGHFEQRVEYYAKDKFDYRIVEYNLEK